MQGSPIISPEKGGSELGSVRVEDIDSKRGLIHVRLGKGGKDRYVMLSARRLVALRRYWVTEVLGGRVDVCTRCGDEKVAFHCIVTGGGLTPGDDLLGAQRSDRGQRDRCWVEDGRERGMERWRRS